MEHSISHFFYKTHVSENDCFCLSLPFNYYLYNSSISYIYIMKLSSMEYTLYFCFSTSFFLENILKNILEQHTTHIASNGKNYSINNHGLGRRDDPYY